MSSVKPLCKSTELNRCIARKQASRSSPERLPNLRPTLSGTPKMLLLLFLDPGTQFLGKKNYAMQRQNTKTSWNVFTPSPPSQNYQEVE